MKSKSSPVKTDSTGSDTSSPNPQSGRTRQRFIKNSEYFTICIYAAVMIVLSAVIIKCIVDIDQTKAFFRQIFTMLGPFIFGALLAYILNPMVHMFYKRISRIADHFHFRLNHKVHTIVSILLTYVIVLGFVILTLLFVIPEIAKSISDFVAYIPTAYTTVLDLISYLQERYPSIDITSISKPLIDILPGLANSLQNFASSLVPMLYSFSVSIAGWIVNLLICIIVSIYMLYDKRRIMQCSWRIIYAFLPQKHIPLCQEILTECNRIFSNYVVGKSIDSLIIGCLCFVLMTILQLPYTIVISLIVGITNMIPYFGPFIGAVPGILIMLLISPLKALIFAVMILVLQQFDGLILGPKILGNSTGMKPLWIIFAITVGGKLAGVIGMFLGVPVVAMLCFLAGRYLEYRLNKKHISDKMIDSALKNVELDD